MIDHYERRVFFSQEDDCFIAVAPELRGCSAFGGTPEAALRELTVAMKLWLETAKKANLSIPIPAADREAQGRILVRVPKSIHRAAIVKAAEEGVSLNQWAVSVFSSAVAVAPRVRAIRIEKSGHGPFEVREGMTRYSRGKAGRKKGCRS